MQASPDHNPWQILVVDDEEGIHGITRMVFRGYRFENRPIELISALSGREARDILQNRTDIALILLDVVMESDDEGLRLIDFVRNTLGNQDVRIILRTGHPGFAPETEVIVDYDINDYLSKAELSASRLLTSVVVALRSYRDIESARRSDSTSSGPTAPDDQMLRQLGRNLRPLAENSLQQSRRLQQLELSPMALELLQTVESDQQRISNSCQLLEQDSRPLLQLQATDVRPLLEQITRTLMPQARSEGRLLDYQLQAQLPSRMRLAGGISTLWLSLLEYCLSTTPGDLLLKLDFDTEGARLVLRICVLSSATMQPDSRSYWQSQPAADHWQQYRLQLITTLCQQLGGDLQMADSAADGSVRELSRCLIPAEAI